MTLSVVAVFVPVAFMKGMVGRFFFQFGVTVAVAVAISYFGVDDAHADDVGAHPRGARPRHDRRRRGASSGSSRRSSDGYRRMLQWALAHRGLTVAAAVGVLVVTVFLGRFLQFTFIPSQDQSGVTVSVELPVGTPLEETQRRGGAARRADPGGARASSTSSRSSAAAWTRR